LCNTFRHCLLFLLFPRSTCSSFAFFNHIPSIYNFMMVKSILIRNICFILPCSSLPATALGYRRSRSFLAALRSLYSLSVSRLSTYLAVTYYYQRAA
jgi:hypothetical protein